MASTSGDHLSSPPAPLLAALRSAVGDANVVTAEDDLAQANTATFTTTARSAVIVRPGTRDEVGACMALAARFGAHVYPTSRGRNWGFGSRAPVDDGAILLDLGRMNRIVAIDEDLAYATVEPGVTFGQLFAELQTRGSRLVVSTVGAGPDASVLANALERGDGSGPYGDHFAHVAALEVVLPSGEIVHTGSDRFAVDRAAPVQRWVAGPALDGLFSQSSLGVVTRMTVWLARKPRRAALLRFSVARRAHLAALVDACRELKLEGTLRAPVGLWNDYRVLSTQQQYPFAETGGATPLPGDLLDRLRASWGGACFFGSTAIYGATTAQAEADLARATAVLRPLVDHLSVNDGGTDATDPARSFIQGIPHEESLRSLYWRKRTPLPSRLDPDADGCGARWVSAALPFLGRDALEVTRVLEPMILAHGFEPLLVFMGQAPRALSVFALIVYDRLVAGEDARALACHDAVVAELTSRGFPLTRLGLPSMTSLPPTTDGTSRLLERLKDALDPLGVLAPGRYAPPPASE